MKLATFKIDANLVIEACDLYLENHERWIKELLYKADGFRDRPIVTGMLWWKKTRMPTDQEVDEYLDMRYWDSKTIRSRIERTGSTHRNNVKHIKSCAVLAAVTHSKVELDTEAMKYLSDHFDEMGILESLQ